MKLKKALLEDLDNFMNGKEYYKKVGKAWKRGYLLYGPPGTGKLSLIAAMANHLKFNIYNLDLMNVYSDSYFTKILLGVSSRSILVIEDIDCSMELHNWKSENEPENNNNQVNKCSSSFPIGFSFHLVKGLI